LDDQIRERTGELMKLLIIVITVHFLIGGAGILFINRKQPHEKRKQNLLKYASYLFIFLVVLSSLLINVYCFTGICLIIFSASLLELLRLIKKPCRSPSLNTIIFIALFIFTILAISFSRFIFLPSAFIAYAYTIVIIFDGASQISGQLAGKRKILPIVSPEKTWAGLIGGTLSALITSVILHGFAGISVILSLVFGAVICAASFAGDMTASALKRAFGAKDFGNFLPGQGGMLDRFDSFIAAGAACGVITLFTSVRVEMADSNIITYLGYSIVFIVIILTGEIIRFLSGLRAEYSRIFSHVLAGIVCLFMMRLFTSKWYVILLCLQSATFMYVTKKMGLLGSHHEVERSTNGSSLFFLGILVSYLISDTKGDPALFILPVTILAFSDPVASLAGLNRTTGFWKIPFSISGSSKTYLGSLAFFISTVSILLAGLQYFYSITTMELIFYSAGISVVVTATEAVSHRGTDNLSIPLVLSVIIGILFR
jgi:phosphatidate cytidylyltransferase